MSAPAPGRSSLSTSSMWHSASEVGQGYRLLDQDAPDVLQVLIDYRK
jgi:hypothetical protein